MIDEHKQFYEFDEFRLDVLKRQLTREGQVVPLYSKAFDLLLVLVRNGGRDLTKDELLDSVWPGQMLEEANLTVNMSAVRKALGEKAARPRYIVTIPGRGYRFVADLKPADGVLIQSQTISQITIEEECETDDAIDVAEQRAAFPREQLSGSSSSESLISTRAQPAALELVHPVARDRRKLLPLVLSSVAVLAVVALGLIYATHKIRQGTAAARFTRVKFTQITNNGHITNATISPDGKLYGFALTERGRTGLSLGQMNGEKQLELIPLADATYQGLEYASDGGAIYFARQDAGQTNFDLYRISVLGGVAAKLHDNVSSFFALAPDSRRAAFVRDDTVNKTSSIVIATLGSANEDVLANLPLERKLGRGISWSPDGSMIAFGANRNGSEPNVAILIAQAATGELKPLTAPLWRNISRVVWLRDGSGLLIIAAGIDPQETRQVWFVAFPGGEAHRVTNDPSLYDRGLSVSSDPNSFLLVQLKQFNNMWVGPADDFIKAKQITFTTFNTATGNFAFDWLPGNKIVYASSQGRGLNLWRMDADGGNVKELSPPGYDDSYPSATADGRFIVFASRRSGAEEIWRADADGANPKQLTTCGRNSQPAVSPDGKWVVYVSACNDKPSLWRTSIEGGQPVRLTDKAVAWPWISPDGQWVACAYESSPEKSQLAIIPIEGSTPAKLFDVPRLANFNFSIRWTQDGKSVTYRDSGMGVWRQGVEGGPPQRLPGLPEEKLYCYGWSRDGKLFAFSRGSEIRDMVLVSNSN